MLGIMSARISKISLIVFVVLLVLSFFLLSVAGNYWPWYSIMVAFAVVPILVGPNRYRLWGAIALTLASLLILDDLKAGRIHQERIHRIMSSQSP